MHRLSFCGNVLVLEGRFCASSFFFSEVCQGLVLRLSPEDLEAFLSRFARAVLRHVSEASCPPAKEFQPQEPTQTFPCIGSTILEEKGSAAGRWHPRADSCAVRKGLLVVAVAFTAVLAAPGIPAVPITTESDPSRTFGGHI